MLACGVEARKDEPGAEARRVVVEHKLAAMQLHDAGDEAQAQAIARLGPALIEPHEALDDALAILGRMPGPRSLTVMTILPPSAAPVSAMSGSAPSPPVPYLSALSTRLLTAWARSWRLARTLNPEAISVTRRPPCSSAKGS